MFHLEEKWEDVEPSKRGMTYSLPVTLSLVVTVTGASAEKVMFELPSDKGFSGNARKPSLKIHQNMADPLSITLATITLATALKDVIELAHMIEESFAKVAQNMRDIHILATEISATVGELKEFCEEHYDILSDAKDMSVALLDLIMNMKTVYNRCCQMVPPAPEKKLRKLKFAFSGWKNSNKIESEVRDLRNHVNKCHSRFMMFAIMRIEKRLIVMGDRNINNSINSCKEFSTEHRVPNENLIAFVGYNQRTLCKLPPDVTAELISDTYLRLQIDAINHSLAGLSSCLTEVSSEPYLCSHEPAVLADLSSDRNVFKQGVISQTLEIQACLRSDSSTLSIRAGTRSMIDLSFRLYSLDMYDETASMGLCALNLCQTLVKTTPTEYLPHLVCGLQRLSYLYISIEDDKKAKVSIEEAISISRHLQMSLGSQEVKSQLGEALRTLAYVLDLEGDYAMSLEAAQESVRAYEEVVIQDHILNGDTSTPFHPSSNKDQSQTLSTFSDKTICDYSKALQQLSFSLQGIKQPEDAVQADMKALNILLHSRLFFTDSVEVDIAALLYRLSHQQFHAIIKLEQALVYSQQAIDIYQSLCEKDKQKHVVSLCHALYEKANTLGKLEQYDEALAIWKETSDLAKDIIDDQVFRADALNRLSSSYHKLKRHDEAATIRTESLMIYQTALTSTSDKIARGYYNLGVDLHFAGRFLEAIEALQVAIERYRALAFNNPDRYTKNIAETLTQLALNLVYSNRHEEAFNDGYESLKLHAIMIDKNPSVMPEYIIALRVNFLVAETAESEYKCLERAHHGLVYSRGLAKRFPEECNLLLMDALLSQTDVFYRFDRLSEASTTIKEALCWLERNLSQNSKEVAEQYMHCLIAYSSIVHNQGYTRKRSELLEKSIEVGKSHSSCPHITDLLIESVHRRAETLGWMGLYAEAVKASVECEILARQNGLRNIVGLIGCLCVCCIASRDIGKPAKAIIFIEEALKLCHTDELEEAAKKKSMAYLLESKCLYNLSECLADIGQEPDALVHAKTSLDATLKLRNKHPTLPWSEIEPSYIEALHTLSMRLAANDDLRGALETIVEIRNYYEKCVKHMSGVSISLAHALYAEGILYCAVGRHDEGIATRTKWQELQSHLDITLPELAAQTRLQMAKEKTYPSMIALLAKLNIRCGHQQEVP
ncbi:hypothetical protein CVT25_007516 [Psilocybe cyanescens]|uniref:Uncharacterized protein n=1 Tax=Psilocybe cyanescens TaxID=93625 RepID=A0A409XGC8_PSICY|nr:hypothetical protein CVT25_007516 [Psilocybe cyanescens]